LFKFSLILISNYLKIEKSLYNELKLRLGVVKMPDTIRLVLFILIAISAVFSLIKEFKKPEKKAIWITIEFLVLFWAIWVIANIII
jgi:uncharacterized membrane protein